MPNNYDIVVVGGGAAGYFGALAAATKNKNLSIAILESGSKTLTKVAVSGGGRCNVTHNCFDTAEFVKYYPRGFRELRGVFSRFQAADTVEWFNSRGVELKAEDDGRMFPVTDTSRTIVNCLENAASDAAISVFKKTKVLSIEKKEKFELACGNGETFTAEKVLIASGGSNSGLKFAETLGHTAVPTVPSLFTFKINDSRLVELPGISAQNVSLTLKIKGSKDFRSEGPLLITHWGLSGPAVLKLSAWAARELFKSKYQARLKVNWLSKSTEDVRLELLRLKDSKPNASLRSAIPAGIARRLWGGLLSSLRLDPELSLINLSKKDCERLATELTAGVFRIEGKGIFKEEFVTCGGVSLKEINFRTMQSKITTGLFFAGEILDIDGLTGGFNFQSAWSTAHIAGSSMGSDSQKNSIN